MARRTRGSFSGRQRREMGVAWWSKERLHRRNQPVRSRPARRSTKRS